MPSAAVPPLWRPAWDWSGACAALAAIEPDLRPALALPITPRPARGLFSQLVRAVCAQQVSVAAADAFEARLVAACGGDVTARALLRLGEPDLRAAGLSRAKAAAVASLARAGVQGRLREDDLAGADDETVIAHLTTLPGIGRWSAEMGLIFALQRPDVWPVGDLGLRRAIALLDRAEAGAPVPTPGAVAARGRPWSPHRSTALLALWAWRRAGTPSAPRAE